MTGRLLSRNQSGLTLIELMVAMVLGLLVAAGIVTVFASTSSSNKAQTQLARLQEEGRFAITRITSDLRMANGEYCSNTGGVAKNTGSNQLYLDGLRAPKVYAKEMLAALSDVTTNWGVASYPAKPDAPYYFPAFLSMRGYNCSKTDPCTPNMPATLLPAMGTGIGARVIGTDVLTMRYMDSSRGWALGGNSTASSDAKGRLTSINLVPAANEPALTDFNSGDLAMVADCSNAQIFAVDPPAGGVMNVRAADNFTGSAPINQQPQSASRLFDLNTDMLTVTYFLQVVDNGSGQKTGALMRRVNGVSDEIVRGVERLDFLYGVEDSNGSTRYLSASDVDSRVGGTFNCPASVPSADSSAPQVNPIGCLWRAVKSVEVRILMDGQVPLYTLAPSDLTYTYAADNNTTPKAPDDSSRAITPTDQGFVNPMLRRQFSALVSLRNYNP
jgi:type IV pilus assembly protein PilW